LVYAVCMDRWKTPEIVELRKQLRVCLMAGHGFNMLNDVLATEDGILEEQRLNLVRLDALKAATSQGVDDAQTVLLDGQEPHGELAAQLRALTARIDESYEKFNKA